MISLDFNTLRIIKLDIANDASFERFEKRLIRLNESIKDSSLIKNKFAQKAFTFLAYNETILENYRYERTPDEVQKIIITNHEITKYNDLSFNHNLASFEDIINFLQNEH